MTPANAADRQDPPFFDRFTKTMLIVMFALLLFVGASAKIMTHYHMAAAGTDDKVNALGSTAAGRQAHPFLELPGDTQVAAFTIASFFVGIIVGYSIQKLFVKKEGTDPEPLEVRGGAGPEEGTAG
jgi:cobalt/nickel transport protein